MRIQAANIVSWDRPRAPEAVASSCASASCYGSAEDIGVVAVVVAKLEFRDVQRHVLGADLMEAADDPALEDRPEAFNCLRMHRADNVLLGAVHDAFVRIFAK